MLKIICYTCSLLQEQLLRTRFGKLKSHLLWQRQNAQMMQTSLDKLNPNWSEHAFGLIQTGRGNSSCSCKSKSQVKLNITDKYHKLRLKGSQMCQQMSKLVMYMSNRSHRSAAQFNDITINVQITGQLNLHVWIAKYTEQGLPIVCIYETDQSSLTYLLCLFWFCLT